MSTPAQQPGFWGRFWGGLTDSTTQPTGFGGWLGRKLRKLLNAATYGLLENKVADYNPTPSELIILNPLKTVLNNWLISLTKQIDGNLEAHNTTAFIANCNLAVAQLQLIKEFYTSYQVSGLSDMAQEYLVEQLEIMLISYQATIEDLLQANGISFTKKEVIISKLPTDTIPVQISIPSGLQLTGFKYELPENQTTVISTQVPISETVTVAPNNTTVNPVTGANDTGMSTTTMVGIGIAAILTLLWGFRKPKGSKKSKKSN